MSNLKPDWAERIQRGRTKFYGKGYVEGSRDMNEFVRKVIINNLLNDAVVRTKTDTKVLARIIQIIEES